MATTGNYYLAPQITRFMLVGIILNTFTIMHLPQYCHRGVVVSIHLDFYCQICGAMSMKIVTKSLPKSLAIKIIFETYSLHFCSI